jgi:cob(I)alamin adenosyltransferase
VFEKGYVHLYTGHGKGKTTAALGMALRAAGWGLRSIFVQFMKGSHYGEIESAKRLGDLITIEQYGSAEFCRLDDANIMEHLQRAKRGLERSREVLRDDRYALVVLDEIVTACLFKLVTLRDILDLVERKPDAKEMVLTGRGAPRKLIERCDLVTEMKEVKHYFNAGVEARQGIER